jgi:chemotaxis protein histidine kinase CheA
VKELDGTMSIHGVHGRGTQLIVRLPLVAARETPLARAAG